MFITACSSTPENPDPLKPFNEDMLELNLTLDENILKPVSDTYKEITADPIQQGISNVLNNLSEPFYAVNYILTEDGEHLLNSIIRFTFNSTLGLFGLFDIAEAVDIPKSSISHKDTLKKWEVPTGDYVMLPVLGPSSARDTVAEPISWFMNPITYIIGWPWMVTKTIVQTINDRAQNGTLIDSEKKDSIGLYSTIKSMYFQKYGQQNDTTIDDAFLDE